MDIENLYKTRQSCRNFADKEVEREKIIKLLELTRLAPSACNSQPWSFHVVSGQKRAEMAKSVQDMGMNAFASNSPAFIAIVEEKATLSEKVGMKFKDQDFVSNDIGIAVAHLIIAACDMGLSTCVLGWINEKKIKKLLELSDKKRVRLVIALGYSAQEDKIREKKRKNFQDIVKFYND